MFVASRNRSCFQAISLVGSVRIIIYMNLCVSCCRNDPKALKIVENELFSGSLSSPEFPLCRVVKTPSGIFCSRKKLEVGRISPRDLPHRIRRVLKYW